jgi:hypothetical protein
MDSTGVVVDAHIPESLTTEAPAAGKRGRQESITAACDLAGVVDELAAKLAATAHRLNCGDDANVRETLRRYAAEIYLLAERLDFLVESAESPVKHRPRRA